MTPTVTVQTLSFNVVIGNDGTATISNVACTLDVAFVQTVPVSTTGTGTTGTDTTGTGTTSTGTTGTGTTRTLTP